jgi:GTP-binding protein
MIIKSASFLKSSTGLKNCPPPELPEYAFIGRSNVGKSSLINSLTGRKGLAKTSSTPGKTQHINHFLINENWYLVDLPGIGYARIAHKEQKSWGSMISEFLLKRDTLVNTFMLVDARLSPQRIDLDFMDNMVINAVPFSIVFTKSDKLGKNQLSSQIHAYRERLLEGWEYLPEIFITSSETRTGTTDILDFIDAHNRMFAENKKKS